MKGNHARLDRVVIAQCSTQFRGVPEGQNPADWLQEDWHLLQWVEGAREQKHRGNHESTYDNWQNYVKEALEVSINTGINTYHLLTVKDYMINVATKHGYHGFHLSGDELTIVKQYKLNKSFMNLDNLFMREENAITPFTDLYKHYLKYTKSSPLFNDTWISSKLSNAIDVNFIVMSSPVVIVPNKAFGGSML